MHIFFQPCISELLFVFQESRGAAVFKYVNGLKIYYHIWRRPLSSVKLPLMWRMWKKKPKHQLVNEEVENPFLACWMLYENTANNLSNVLWQPGVYVQFHFPTATAPHPGRQELLCLLVKTLCWKPASRLRWSQVFLLCSHSGGHLDTVFLGRPWNCDEAIG